MELEKNPSVYQVPILSQRLPGKGVEKNVSGDPDSPPYHPTGSSFLPSFSHVNTGTPVTFWPRKRAVCSLKQKRGSHIGVDGAKTTHPGVATPQTVRPHWRATRIAALFQKCPTRRLSNFARWCAKRPCRRSEPDLCAGARGRWRHCHCDPLAGRGVSIFTESPGFPQVPLGTGSSEQPPECNETKKSLVVHWFKPLIIN